MKQAEIIRKINFPEIPDNSKVDQLYASKQKSDDFNFGDETAAVFDDMVSRSVPYYSEIQRMTCEIARSFAVPGTNIYDVGCATGTTLHELDELIDPEVHFIGIDNSDDMLARAKSKLKGTGKHRKFDFINADLNDPPQFKDASVVIMLLTLQFVRPLNRMKLIKNIYEGMRDDACLILVEKITATSSLLNRVFIEYYYEYKKRKGYSELEISQKREALENVLIPYHHEENRQLLNDAGFSHIDEFFRWYNFSGVIAVK